MSTVFVTIRVSVDSAEDDPAFLCETLITLEPHARILGWDVFSSSEEKPRDEDLPRPPTKPTRRGRPAKGAAK